MHKSSILHLVNLLDNVAKMRTFNPSLVELLLLTILTIRYETFKMLCNFIEITLRHGCSPVNLLHIFRIPLYKNTSGRLLLILYITEANYQKEKRKIRKSQNKHKNKNSILIFYPQIN